MSSSARLVFTAAVVAGLGLSIPSAGASILYWDINGADPGATDDPDGLAGGTWDTSTTNWTTDPTGAGPTQAWVDGNIATFSAGSNATGAFDIVVDGNPTITGLHFKNGDVTLTRPAGSTLILSGTPEFLVTSPIRGFIQTEITGSVRWTKTGPGLLRVANPNTNTGGITINEGTLQIVADTALGAVPGSATPGYLVFNGGTLENNNGGGNTSLTLHANRGINVESGGGTIHSGTGTIFVNGAVTGSGTLTNTGANITLFAANNSGGGGFSGKHVVLNGWFQSNNAANGGEAGFGVQPASFVADAITLDGGGLRNAPQPLTVHENRGITLGAGGGNLNTAHATNIMTINSVISGVGSLTKTGYAGATPASTQFPTSVSVLNADNTYTGDTFVDIGTLRLNGSLANSNITIASGASMDGGTGAAGGTLNFNIVDDNSDLITIAGTGTLNISNLNLLLNVSGSQSQMEYVIADKAVATANILGTSFRSESLPSGWFIEYGGTMANPDSIVAVVPEPASLGLLALGGLLLHRRRN
jgi:autotransporter-associated beta strand protein